MPLDMLAGFWRTACRSAVYIQEMARQINAGNDASPVTRAFTGYVPVDVSDTLLEYMAGWPRIQTPRRVSAPAILGNHLSTLLGARMPDINQAERALRAWPILTATAKRKETITYLQLGNSLGIHHRAVRFVLGPIQDYCMEAGLPPLTILVVNGSGHPGSGFIALDLNYFDEGLNSVWSKDWKSVENPFEFASSGTSYGSLLKRLTTSPDDSEEVYVKVKSRGIKQLLFRDALLHAYSRKCAFTGISIPETLEACHIVPWSQSTPQQRMDIRNGLLLNVFHHRLFDRGYITISKDHNIVYCDPKGKDREHSAFERPFTIGLHGKPMAVPRLLKHRPLAEYIEHHHRIAEWEI